MMGQRPIFIREKENRISRLFLSNLSSDYLKSFVSDMCFYLHRCLTTNTMEVGQIQEQNITKTLSSFTGWWEGVTKFGKWT